jgi:hypothetical protein
MVRLRDEREVTPSDLLSALERRDSKWEPRLEMLELRLNYQFWTIRFLCLISVALTAALLFVLTLPGRHP